MGGRKFKTTKQPKRHRGKVPEGNGDHSRSPARGGHPPKRKRTCSQQVYEDLTEVMENSIQCNESLDELMQSVTLPPHWTISTTTEKNDTAVITVNNGKVVSIPSDFTLPTTSTQPLVVTHCITVRNDFFMDSICAWPLHE